MLRVNPLITGIWRGLVAPEVGAAQRTYFGCLALQAAALVLWWPKHSLGHALSSEQGPQPLLAVIAVLGLTTAYYSLRAGAEEILLPGQQSLREWALGTRLPIGRILGGSLLGHLMQTLFLITLSLPLIAIAYTVGGGRGDALALAMCTVLIQALFFWVAGAVLYLGIGERAQLAFIAGRALLCAGYVLTAWRLAGASHLMVSIELLGTGGYRIDAVAGIAGYHQFLLLHTALIVLLGIVLYLQLRRFRRRSTPARSPGAPAAPG